MASNASISKNRLVRRIEEHGFTMVFSCVRCVRLNKRCVKSSDSDRCSECVKMGSCKCEEAPLPSATAWNRLISAQRSLEDEEEATLAKLLRLRKQKKLLSRRAGDFLQRDISEIEELERLEEEDRRKAEEEKRKAAVVASASSSSENPPGSSLCSGDTPFLSPDFVFDESMFSSSQVDAAFASILAEPPGRSEDAQ
jgi:hypothetical protein